MQSAWIRGVGFFGAIASLAAACSMGVDPPSGLDDPGSRLLKVTVGGATNIGGALPLPVAGVGGALPGTGGATAQSVTVGAGGAQPISGSSTSVTVGVGGAQPISGSSTSVTVGVGGAPTSTGSSTSTGMMMTKSPNGAACLQGSDCQSASCVDGFCCNIACTGSCVACSAAKKGGGANGVCAAIGAGLDPDSECLDPPPQSPCAAPGVCNGNGACALPTAANVPCGNGSCSGNPGTAFGPPACDGGGGCKVGKTTVCAGPCNGTICLQGCMNDAQCQSTEYCAAMICTPKKGLGIACGGAAECAVGYCVEGVCCDSACTTGGACQTCLKAAGATSDGTCTLLNGKLPGNPCDDGKACTDDACGGGACVHAAVVCPAASDACHVASACDMSTGQCLAEQPVVCPVGGLADCLTRVCDVTAANGPCVVRSSLDGVTCSVGTHAGICLAGSCFTVSGIEGTGGAGGLVATSSNGTGAGASAATGAGGVGGEGSSGGFHFAGGACNIVNDGETSLDGAGGRAAWLLAAALFAARRRAARAGITSRRGPGDA